MTPTSGWSRAGRYLFAAAAGLAAWCASAAVLLSVPLSAAQEDAVGAALVTDLALGGVTLALLPLRRRSPLFIACAAVALSSVSVAALGAAAVAVVSLATRRRRAWVGIVLAVSAAGGVASEWLYRPRLTPGEDSVAAMTGGVVLTVLLFAAAVAAGYYVGIRRELVTSLHERVLTADRERALATRAAREAERTRIAREMHDVLAHRISLVALHAGALVYREDLSRAQTAETAGIIQANTRLALVELRQVLGVLRGGHPADGAEQPQPTLTELPALLADAHEADAAVRLDTSGLGTRLPTIPETLSRTSFRIIQEALTNARKHAPGEPVTVRLAGRSGSNLTLDVRNPLGARTHPAPPGVGLAGLTERAELAGGTLRYGAEPAGWFVLTATLPWPA